MKKKVGIIKRIFSLLLVFLFSINSFAAVVSDNDGSAFITKAEFDSLKNSFQSQIDSYNTSIDNKIDGAIASYLAGIRTGLKPKVEVDLLNDGVVYKTWAYDFSTDWNFYKSPPSSQWSLTYSPGIYSTFYYTYGSKDSSNNPQNHWETQDNIVETMSGEQPVYYSNYPPKQRTTNFGNMNYVVRYCWRRYGWAATNTYGSSYSAKGVYFDSNTFPRRVNQSDIPSYGYEFDSATERAFPLYIMHGHLDDITQIVRPSSSGSAYIFLYKPWSSWTNDVYRFKDSVAAGATINRDNVLSSVELKTGPRVREGNLMRGIAAYIGINGTSFKSYWSFKGDTTLGSICRDMPTEMYWNCFAFPDQIYWEDGYIKLWGKWNQRSTDGDLNIHMNWATGKTDVEPSYTKNVVTYNKTKSSVTSGSTWCFFDSQVSAPGCKAGSVGLAIDINSSIGYNETPFTWLDFYGLPQIDLGYELFTTDGESQGIKWFWVNGVVNNSLLGGL